MRRRGLQFDVDGTVIDWPYVRGWCVTWDILPALTRLEAELAELR